MATILIKRTEASGPPPALSLAAGELAVELATPVAPRLWVGVPTTIDPNGQRLVSDAGAYLPLTGGTLNGALNVAPGAGANALTVAGEIRATMGVYAADYTFTEVATGDTWNWYADAGNARLWHGTADVWTISALGDLTLPGGATVVLGRDPAAALEAATKQYVDAVAGGGPPPDLSGYLPLTGGTLTGPAAFNMALGGPIAGGRAPGTRLVLFPNAAGPEIGLGVQPGSMWFGGRDANDGFVWYGGTVQVANLTGAGNLWTSGSITSDPTGRFVAVGGGNPGITMKNTGGVPSYAVSVGGIPGALHFGIADTATHAPTTQLLRLDQAGNLSMLAAAGRLTLAGDPTAALHAATKQYVDAVRASIGGPYLPLTGGSLTGPLSITGPATAGASSLRIAGGTQGIRFNHLADRTSIEAVDNTWVGSFQTLQLSGSGITLTAPTTISANVLIDATLTTTDVLSANGSLRIDNGAGQLNVIGDTSPTQRSHFFCGRAGNTNQPIFQIQGIAGWGGTDIFFCGTTSAIRAAGITSAGTVFGTGPFVEISDSEGKTSINDSPYGLDQVMALRPRIFIRDGFEEAELGWIAQEVAPLIPEAVTPFDQKEPDGPLGIKVSSILPAVVTAVQQLAARIAALEAAP